jgi:hypothetical protein
MMLAGSKTAAIPNANAKSPLRISFHQLRGASLCWLDME